MKYLIGIDEVGRGPLAGPVAVGAVMMPVDFDWSLLEGVRDSKKLSEKKREDIFERARELERRSLLRFSVSTSSATYIDRYGIVPAIKRALAEALEHITKGNPLFPKGLPFVQPKECKILLDGSLIAPAEYVDQKTIIRGDDSEPVISLASVMAKVTRDRMMKKLSAKYPEYDFHVHKGYGTLAHRKVIQQCGLSDLHRVSFCSRLHADSKSV